MCVREVRVPRDMAGGPGLSARVAAARRAHPRQSPAKAAEPVLAEAGRHLGIALAPVVTALNLSEIVLSGPSELLDGSFSRATIETLRERTMAEVHGDLVVWMTTLGADIVLRGAAVMVLSEQLGLS